jgi:ABC-type multidrug transport system fused ATPase/permease subunit
VSFGYHDDQRVLDDVNLVVEAGQSVALVGPTGSGKTTIASLIAKLHCPDSGAVLIDRHDLARITGASLRRQLAVVPQQSFLFDGTIADNIRFGRPASTFDELIESLCRLDCLDLFENLPRGLATPVGPQGARLSLGQRQLTCLARAMLVDPRIVILDEATSSVDPWTEARVQTALRRLAAQRTSVIIAHRLSTIEWVDLILVMRAGRIVERGRHEDLLAARGIYARMHRAGETE